LRGVLTLRAFTANNRCSIFGLVIRFRFRRASRVRFPHDRVTVYKSGCLPEMFFASFWDASRKGIEGEQGFSYKALFSASICDA